MVKGVGIDLMDMRRISRDMPLDDAFIRHVFSDAERDSIVSSECAHRHICSRFSAKEAVFKSLGREGDGFSMAEVEILIDEIGRPIVNLTGLTAELAQAAGIADIFVSISFDGGFVTSVAVADGPVR